MNLTHEVIRLMLRRLGFKIDSSVNNLFRAIHHKNAAFYTAVASGVPNDLLSYRVKLIELGGDEVTFPLVSDDNFINLRTAIDRFFITAANNPTTKFERRWLNLNGDNRSHYGYGTVPMVGHDERFPYLKLYSGSYYNSNSAYVWRIGGGVGLILYYYDRSFSTYTNVVRNERFTIDEALELVSEHCR